MDRSEDIEESVCAIVFYEVLSIKPWCRFLSLTLALTRAAICAVLAAVSSLSVPLEDSFPVLDVIIPRLLPVDHNREIFFIYLLISSALTWFAESLS